MEPIFSFYSPEFFRPANFDYLLPESYRKKIRLTRELNRSIILIENSLDYRFGFSKTQKNHHHSRKLLKYCTAAGGALIFSLPLIAAGKYSIGVVEWAIKHRLPNPLSSEDSITLFDRKIYHGVEVRTGNPSRKKPNTIHHGSPLEILAILSLEFKSSRNISRAKRLYGEKIAIELEDLYSKLKDAKIALLLSSNYQEASSIFKEARMKYKKLEVQLPKRKLFWKILRWFLLTFMVNKTASDMSGEQGWEEVNRLGHSVGDGVGPLRGGPFDWGYYDICELAVTDLGMEKFRIFGWEIAFSIRELLARIYRAATGVIRKVLEIFT